MKRAIIAVVLLAVVGGGVGLRPQRNQPARKAAALDPIDALRFE